MSTTPHPRTAWRKAIALGAVASLAALLLVLAFLWPGRASVPRHLPLSVVGTSAEVNALQAHLEGAASETFTLTPASNRTEAAEQIAARRTVGAIVFGSDGSTEVLFASAAGSAQSQAMHALAAGLEASVSPQPQGRSTTVTLTDVAPLSSGDPTGAGLTASAFPLALGGVLAGILIALLVHGTWQRFTAALVFAAVAGALIEIVLQPWFHFIQGNPWLNFLAIALTILATASFMIGLVKLLGKPGLGISAVITMFIGNPLSGATVPWQYVPAPWGLIGQFMVPGAGSSLLRSLSYFPSAATWPQWLTLVAWIVFGGLLATCGHGLGLRRRSAAVRSSS